MEGGGWGVWGGSLLCNRLKLLVSKFSVSPLDTAVSKLSLVP